MAARDSARVPLAARRALGESAKQMTVLIAGGGIAGLTLGLTLHQISIPFHIFETHTCAKTTWGRDITCNPPQCVNSLRLALKILLDEVGIQTRDYGFYTPNRTEIWTEPRGCPCGIQLAAIFGTSGPVADGASGCTAYANVATAASPLSARVRRYETNCDRATVHYEVQGSTKTASADMLIGADGIHSGVRAQMYPTEGPPVWGGAIMWRGTSLAKPYFDWPVNDPCWEQHATLRQLPDF